MSDPFDFNNDGKIDNIEGAMRWDMIDHMMSDSGASEDKTYTTPEPRYAKSSDYWISFLKVMGMIIMGYAFLFLMANLLF